MGDTHAEHVTRLLQNAGRRDDAREQLLALVYDHLRRIAQERMNRERAGHTLEATGLVHEVFLRLLGEENISWQNRAHFYAAAAQAMRRILIDHARKRRAEKRGGSRGRVPLSVVDLAAETDPDQILALDEALDHLERTDPRAASVVRLRFFAGLGVAETAAALELSERTVMRDWAYARAVLFNAVTGDGADRPGGGPGDDA